MADSNIDFDLAQALVDLSIQPQHSTSIEPPESYVRNHETPAKVNHVLNPADSLSTPVRSIVVNSEADELPARPKLSAEAEKQGSLIVLQDACRLHKFSRQVRQKDLETIVERPERTRAAILGIMTAQARLQAESMPHFDIVHSERRGWLGDSAVEKVHGFTYPQELLHISQKVSEALMQGKLEIPEVYPYGDLYLGPQSLDAINGCLGALYDGVDAIFKDNYNSSHVCIRPPGHHAAETSPCGFCWINNVHIAIAYAQERYHIKKAVILDFDLHHGDGSQSIAWTLNQENPGSIGYFSIHDINSYPCESGNIEKIREASVSIAAHGHNVHNVHLKPYTTQEQFDQVYSQDYATIFQKARQYLEKSYSKGEQALVCISAGYDASEYESSHMQRHKVSVPTSFYQRFTEDAVRLASDHPNCKILSVMEGGYGDRAITSAACSHMLGLVSARAQDSTHGDVSEWYNLDNLKIIEKSFPGKAKGVRKPVKVDGTEGSWLQILDGLYNQHVSGDSKVATAEAFLMDDLGRMTLRERKVGPPTPASVQVAKPVRRTPRSTPVKAKINKIPATPSSDSIPPLPSIPSHLTDSTGNVEAQTRHDDSPVPRTTATQPDLKLETSERQTTTETTNAAVKTIISPKIPDIYDFVD